MMSVLAHLGMAIHLAALLLLLRVARPSLRASREAWTGEPTVSAPASQPALAMIIPMTGDTPAMRESLASLLHQPGWEFSAFLAVRDESDLAATLARELSLRFPHARLVIAGETQVCCQKNHNLLAGIREAGSAPDILVFCDSAHQALPDFLTRLTEPLREGTAEVASTYHPVFPADMGFVRLLHVFSAQLVQQLQALPKTPLLWGGATAVRRDTFLRHGVDAIWARAVVDDFIMGPHLLRRGVPMSIVPSAALLTRHGPGSFTAWWHWWFRQLHYMKFCLPWVWLVVTLAPIIGGALLAYSLMDLAKGGFSGLAYGLALGVIGVRLGRLCVLPIPGVRAGLGFLAMQILTIPCYLATWFTNTIRWRGVAYRARFGGSVAAVLRDPRR